MATNRSIATKPTVTFSFPGITQSLATNYCYNYIQDNEYAILLEHIARIYC